MGFGHLLKDTSLEEDKARYVAAWLLIVGNAVVLWWRRHELVPWLCGGAGIFLISLAMRMADEQVCACIPVGTHFLWHILNATLFAVLLTGFVRHCPRLDTSGTNR